MISTSRFSLPALAAFAALVSWTCPANAQGVTAASVTEGIQAFYKSTSDYQASFEQIFTDTAAGDSTTKGGRVFFKKPGMMRWDYLDRSGAKTVLEKVLVSDGKAFTIYEPAVNQYFRKCLKDSTLPTALSFLVGEGELQQDFTPKLLKAKRAGTYEVEMTPKRSSGQYKKIVFIVDAVTFAVQETVIFDPYGNTNRLVFSKPLVNKKLPASGFDFPPPQGARPVGNVDVKCD